MTGNILQLKKPTILLGYSVCIRDLQVRHKFDYFEQT